MKKLIIAILLFLVLVHGSPVGARKEEGRTRFRDRDDDPSAELQASQPTQAPAQPTPTGAAARVIRESDSAIRDFLDEPTDHPMTPTPTPKGFAAAPTSTPINSRTQSAPRVSGDELTVAFLIIALIAYAIRKGWVDQLQKKYFHTKKRRR